MSRPATEIHVKGIVQGVGFRPFVYRLAQELCLKGHITNRGDGVLITVAGKMQSINALVDTLRNSPPPLARIVSLQCQDTTLPEGTELFSIIESDTGQQSSTHVSPDIATCENCLQEILDPANRRNGYPFTNCTNCGPRYTIIRSLPYDRPRTTMDAFPMCPECKREYQDPLNRRFHAQPNACSACGPKLEWMDINTGQQDNTNPLDRAVKALVNGKVVGIKGLGGFHLAVDAFSNMAVNKLRERKKRPAKPLAVMVRDIETAHRLCDVLSLAELELTKQTSPIVLLRRKTNCKLADNLAPGIEELGLMLPYTPLHHLLFSHPETPPCLVMTSGNATGEPLCKDNDDALEKLGHFCDGFLLHNRDIHTRVDDSVIRIINQKPRFLRRSRGYTPAPVQLTHKLEPVLAVGGELKNCFCLARNNDAFMSQHIGDLSNLPTLEFFEQTYERLKSLLEIEPKTVVADLHPDYLSTRFAESLGLPVTKVQHHWAHAASVMAEHGLKESLAIILDGTGFGPDNTVWGGEVLHCNLHEYKRLGRLSPLPLPGGDKAAKQPWRMAVSILHCVQLCETQAATNLKKIGAEEIRFIREMIDKNVNCPQTSSCGRLFDGVSSLLGICHQNTFEGQAAMELEAMAAKALGRKSLLETDHYADINSCDIFQEINGLQEVSTQELTHLLADRLKMASVNIPEIALFFHVFLVSSFGNMIRYLSEKIGIDTVVLSGGSIQNRILTEGFVDFFSNTHLKLYTNVQVPANDGGLALGQAVIGGAHVPGNSHAGE